MTDQTKYRVYEIIPGALVWGTLITAIALSFVKPLWAMYFIIVFDLYWLFRVVYFVFYLFVSWRRYKETVKIDWMEKLVSFSNFLGEHPNLNKEEMPNWEDYYHLIFLPTYKEPYEVLRTTFKSLMKTSFPKDKMIIVLAGEERDQHNFLSVSDKLKAEFGEQFCKFLVTIHPKHLPDEIPGKGSNLNWSGQKAQELIDQLEIPYEKVIVSSFDVDTCVHPQYFAYLTYKYMTHPNPTRSSFQPVALYNNNIWESMSFIRVASFGTTFWLLTDLAKPERLFTFSSHSMSFKALVDVGFWQKDIVTEDSRIFLQCFLHYDGEYQVTPMYIPVSMDTVMTEGKIKSMVNLYKQQRRWAWGIEHFPYMVHHFSKKKGIPVRKKMKYLWNLGEGMFSWATSPLLIFVLGYLPRMNISGDDATTVLAQNTPHILQFLMSAAMAGIFISAIFSLLLLPPRPKGKGKASFLVMAVQWIFLPFTLVIFGAIPAVDAQTRLMLGRHLGFNVTEKTRKINQPSLETA